MKMATQPEPCVWHQDDWGGDSVWETSCGHAFEFNEGGPTENQIAFCGYCGHLLLETRSSDAPPSDEE